MAWAVGLGLGSMAWARNMPICNYFVIELQMFQIMPMTNLLSQLRNEAFGKDHQVVGLSMTQISSVLYAGGMDASFLLLGVWSSPFLGNCHQNSKEVVADHLSKHLLFGW